VDALSKRGPKDLGPENGYVPSGVEPRLRVEVQADLAAANSSKSAEDSLVEVVAHIPHHIHATVVPECVGSSIALCFLDTIVQIR
jgi:hypothetical protein